MLTIPAGDNVVRILPPLTSTDEDIKTALERVEEAVSHLSATGRDR
jgi:acetylornithine/N-succinyldiaminopimelate aminotransferase